MIIPDLETCFLEVRAHVSLKVATNDSFRGKQIHKFSILSLFLKQKWRSATKKNWSTCHKFCITIPCSVTYFLKVRPHISLTVTTKKFSIFKAIFLKQKQRSAIKKAIVRRKTLAYHLLEVGVRISLKAATKLFLEVKKTLKF